MTPQKMNKPITYRMAVYRQGLEPLLLETTGTLVRAKALARECCVAHGVRTASIYDVQLGATVRYARLSSPEDRLLWNRCRIPGDFPADPRRLWQGGV